jgi:superfamily II DNA or RNA helicase
MKVKLPAIWTLNVKFAKLGHVRQLLLPEQDVRCRAVSYTREKDVGHLLLDEDGQPLGYLFSKEPKSTAFTQDEQVLVANYDSAEVEELDVSSGYWLHHPLLHDESPIPSQLAVAARESWRGAFRFAEEDSHQGVIGLRRPQVGALHAIHAHWSTSRETATVVMPTGTGKTETMLSTLTSALCHRVLVIVPTDALRTQIAGKFESLGVLKLPGNAVLASNARCPVVGTFLSRPRTEADVDAFFSQCNVIVASSHLVGGCDSEVQARMAELCSHLFIDEAHHAEAATWKAFRTRFADKAVLQFTATPFREDGQKIDGKLVYVYPLRKAQEEGYFRPIRFREVHEFDVARGDQKIAEAALDELDADSTGKHIVMARVDGVSRAESIHALYKSLGRYETVVIHSSVPTREREEAKRKLFKGVARVVVCVDMLGEGFDLPELKIAAFHDIRKSLAVTLQLAGRFTRVRADLGDPVFIANTALIDVNEELRALYAQDPDWNVLLPTLSAAVIDQEVASQEFFRGFEAFLAEVPLKDLRPAASMVVYKTHCANWNPKHFKKGFRGLTPRDKLYHSLNERENTLVVLTATEQGVRWSDVESIRELGWELIIAVWDRDQHLLYLHGSSISGSYKEIAKALCGNDVELMVAPNLFRCFYGVNRLVLNNVGLNEHLGRQVQYTGRMGSDVEARIGQAARQGATKAVLAGQGFERGQRSSVGAAKRGRVWSNLRLRVDTFAAWARGIGQKLVDESIDPNAVLAGTLKPDVIGSVPTKVAIAVEWPIEVLARPEHGTNFLASAVTEEPLTNVDLEVCPRADDGPIVVRVFCDRWERLFQLELFSFNDSFDFRFTLTSGPQLNIRRGKAVEPLAEFFTEYPPVIWFADGSSLEGCKYVELPSNTLQPFPTERLTVLDWTGVDIKKESQGESRKGGTVQHRLIELLQGDSTYEVIFDDDGSGEAADVVAVRVLTDTERSTIEVELYHCKYAGGAPGGRVDDLYVVCGQAQRSIGWLANHERRTELFTHLLKRDSMRTSQGRSTRFERGDVSTLMRIRDMSRMCEVRLRVAVVQPGLSVAAATRSQLTLLAVTERYLSDTYEIPLRVLCSA